MKAPAIVDAEDISVGYSSYPARHAENLFGHAGAEKTLLDAWAGGRLPHAWLISGAKGIGKVYSEKLAAANARVVIADIDAEGAAKLKGIAAETVILPTVDPFVAPILYAIPVQVLAYHVAVLKGTDVDQPRNLAKSVTVE